MVEVLPTEPRTRVLRRLGALQHFAQVLPTDGLQAMGPVRTGIIIYGVEVEAFDMLENYLLIVGKLCAMTYLDRRHSQPHWQFR